MFKLLVTVLALLHYGLCDLECYDCTSWSGPNQDDGCDQDGYSGKTTAYSSWQSCLTETHSTGSVRRYGSTLAMEDGECMGFGNSMTCYCTTALCNNDLCQDCGVILSTTPAPSPTTTPGATDSTLIGTTDNTDVTEQTSYATETTDVTEQTSYATETTDVTEQTSYATETNEPTDTTDNGFTTTMKTTNQPGDGLRCYVCVDCSVVDENTDVVQNEDYNSCVTTIALSGNFIIRGGDYDVHPDGDCVHEDGGMVCYCNEDLCNDQSYVV